MEFPNVGQAPVAVTRSPQGIKPVIYTGDKVKGMDPGDFAISGYYPCQNLDNNFQYN